MELMNCRNCKRLFNYITGERICPGCKSLLEDKFNTVKEFVRENPGKNINQVAEETETSIKQLKQWVREERLTFTDDSLVGLECERCGRMVHSGRFCASCAGGLADSFTEAYRTQRTGGIRKTASGKMRFLE